MIAADTSTWMAFLGGAPGFDVELLSQSLRDRQVLMVPVVLSELLSDPKMPAPTAASLCDLPCLEIAPSCWQRAGVLRAKVLAKQRKARLADALIAQSCLDHDLRLLTRDRDVQAFAEHAELNLVITA